ncbi:glycoside hydrolase family 28 protein [Ancylomarina sp. 16SWW S1-10-2]|uniref:glycoside hydrolase family 28 protein n=1 Tax=Ancylomarina sp. 16SWW S1-10-2 TaxID=2499681 RepID=UPI0012AD8C1A|nr:glycosyl hydrolase family 28 protein [Ancylomarina sp. 16SWW S1-10-2]MRT93194.1 glycoside hydrolase family 28 protein [Ancylomarina sp. 16SWW S1-10-2]
MKNRLNYRLARTFCLFNIIALCFVSGFDASAKSKHKKYVVTEFGSVNDGITINTLAIQTLINKVNKRGGGTIVFPTGEYLSGSLLMKSNVNLYLEKDAILLGSINPLDYPQVDMPGRPKLPSRDDNSQMAFLVAHKANDFTISGEGKIDGQGRALALTIDSLYHAGELVDPKYSTRRNRPHETARPKLFRFSQCNNVNILNLNLWNASCWGLSFELCKNLTLDSLKVVNRAYWNNDGMDITDCTNVRITNCDVDSADDGICLKSYYPGYCNDSIYIANCTIRSSASAIKFGTASYGGFKNVSIKNINIYDTFRSAIAIESVDGGVIENIEVSNIVAENTGNAIFIRLGHRDGKKPGRIKNIYIHDIKVQVPFGIPDLAYDMRGPAVNFFHNPLPSSISGIPGHLVEDVMIENIEITYPGRSSKGMAYVPLSRLNMVPERIKSYPEFTMFGELPAWAFYVRHVKGITVKNVNLKLENEDYRPAFVFDQVEDIEMDQVKLPAVKHKQVVLKETKEVKLSSDLEGKKKEL